MMGLVRLALCRPLSVAVMALLMLSSVKLEQVISKNKHRAASLWRMGHTHQNDPIRQEHQNGECHENIAHLDRHTGPYRRPRRSRT
jgi:hypothetical protein